MNSKAFSFLASVIFLLIAAGHLSRLVFKWSAVVGGWVVPFWASWAAMLLFACLAYLGFRLARKLR